MCNNWTTTTTKIHHQQHHRATRRSAIRTSMGRRFHSYPTYRQTCYRLLQRQGAQQEHQPWWTTQLSERSWVGSRTGTGWVTSKEVLGDEGWRHQIPVLLPWKPPPHRRVKTCLPYWSDHPFQTTYHSTTNSPQHPSPMPFFIYFQKSTLNSQRAANARKAAFNAVECCLNDSKWGNIIERDFGIENWVVVIYI